MNFVEDLTQLQHAVQTAEACRKAYPGDEFDWFHVAAFIHDLGKILAVDDAVTLASNELSFGTSIIYISAHYSFPTPSFLKKFSDSTSKLFVLRHLAWQLIPNGLLLAILLRLVVNLAINACSRNILDWTKTSTTQSKGFWISFLWKPATREKKELEFLRFQTKLGIYSHGCGLDHVTKSWGHDEYIYYIAKEQSTLPEKALYMLRYHR